MAGSGVDSDPGATGAAHERQSAERPGTLGARSILVLAILFALQIADGIDQAALSFTAPYVRRELGIGVESLGASFSAGYLGTALGAVLFGTIADRIGRKFGLCAASFAFSVGSLCTILVHTGGQLFAVRLLTGLALGGLFPVVATVILETVPARARATAVTLVSVGTAAGVSLCGPLTALLEPRFGWRSIFILGGTIPAIFSVLALFAIAGAGPGRASAIRGTPDARARPRNPLSSVLSLFDEGRWRITVILWAAFIASAVPMFFSLSWLPSLAHSAGVKPGIAAIGPALFSVCGLLLALVVAPLIDRKGFMPLAVSTVLGAPALVVVGQSFGSDTAFLVACCLAGALLVSSVNLLGAVAGLLYPPELRARGVGWAVAVMRLGAALAPGLGGFLLARNISVGSIFLALAVCPIISAVAIVALQRGFPRGGRQRIERAPAPVLAGTIRP